jgi:hypothetical protein
MPWTFSGKIIAPTPRVISLTGQTIVQLLATDVILQISSVSGDAPRLVQISPDALEEGRTIILYNSSGGSVELGPPSPLASYVPSDFDLIQSTLGDGGVKWFRYYIDGGPPGSQWPGWYQF